MICDTRVANSYIDDTYDTSYKARSKRRGAPREQELPMNNGSVSISPPSLASAKHVAPSATARTKLLLEGPILTTLLRLAAPNILNLLAFAGVITFDGF